MSMRDIDIVIAEVERHNSNIRSTQLQVKHPGYDDDAIWFFWIPEAAGEVQAESSHGMLPFIVQTDKHNQVVHATTIGETVDTILAWLQLPGGSLISSFHPK